MDAFLKVAPTLVILAVATFSLWPYLPTSETPPPAQAAAAKELGASLLAPEVGKPHARNPFRDPEVVRQALAAKVVESVKSWSAQRKAAARTAKLKTSVAQKAADAGKKQAQKTTGHAPDPAVSDVRNLLTLNATYVQGSGGVALINDHLYEQGEAIKGIPSDKGPCLLSEVHHDEVVLNCKGSPLVLKYPVKSSSNTLAMKMPSTSKNAAAPAPKAATTTRSRKKK